MAELMDRKSSIDEITAAECVWSTDRNRRPGVAAARVTASGPPRIDPATVNPGSTVLRALVITPSRTSSRMVSPTMPVWTPRLRRPETADNTASPSFPTPI